MSRVIPRSKQFNETMSAIFSNALKAKRHIHIYINGKLKIIQSALL